MSSSAPLLASAFERYMLADDSADHPMTFLMRFEFAGEADAPLLKAAFGSAARRHPLLTAKPERARKRWIWQAQDRPISFHVGGPGEALLCPRGLRIDLSQEAGVRLWCRVGHGRTTLTLQGHHACCDGIGALQFFFDGLAEYHRQSPGSPINGTPSAAAKKWGREINADLLAERDRFDFTPPERVSLPTQARAIVTEAGKLLLRQPQVFAAADARATPALNRANELPELHVRHLDEEISAAYRAAAQAQGVMANDLFLRDMFLALVEWAERCGRPLPKKRWLRLTMPINLRKREQSRMSAANVISYAFITRRAGDVADPEALLASIHAETEAIKYWKLGGMFLAGVGAIDGVGLLRPLLRLPGCFSSLVLSNLGDIRHCSTARFPLDKGCIQAGNLRLESFAAAPPPRAKTNAAVVVSRYAGRFSLGLQTTQQIPAASAKEFLACYEARLAATARGSNQMQARPETT